MMDAKFIIKAECRVDNIDFKAYGEEISREIEEIFEYSGIKAVVEVSGLTYINEAEGE